MRDGYFATEFLASFADAGPADRRGDALHGGRQRLHHPLHREAPLTPGT